MHNSNNYYSVTDKPLCEIKLAMYFFYIDNSQVVEIVVAVLAVLVGSVVSITIVVIVLLVVRHRRQNYQVN